MVSTKAGKKKQPDQTERGSFSALWKGLEEKGEDSSLTSEEPGFESEDPVDSLKTRFLSTISSEEF